MQQPTGDGMPDFRFKFIHGTRFGGIKGYGIGWRLHRHSLVKYQQGGHDLMMERGRGKKKKKSYYHTARHHHHRHHGKKKKGSIDHNAMRGDGGGPQSLRHGMVTDVGARESMWGHVEYPDRVLRNRHHQR